MSWRLVAGCVEFIGNLALVATLALTGWRRWPSNALRLLVSVVGVYALTNVFYAAAYIGRTTSRWEWWDTPVEAVVYQLQVATMWGMLLTGINAVAASRG